MPATKPVIHKSVLPFHYGTAFFSEFALKNLKNWIALEAQKLRKVLSHWYMKNSLL